MDIQFESVDGPGAAITNRFGQAPIGQLFGLHVTQPVRRCRVGGDGPSDRSMVREHGFLGPARMRGAYWARALSKALQTCCRRPEEQAACGTEGSRGPGIFDPVTVRSMWACCIVGLLLIAGESAGPGRAGGPEGIKRSMLSNIYAGRPPAPPDRNG